MKELLFVCSLSCKPNYFSECFWFFYHRGFSGHAQLLSRFSQSALQVSKLCIVFHPSLCFKMKADHSDFQCTPLLLLVTTWRIQSQLLRLRYQPHPCPQLLSDLPSWPPLPSRVTVVRSSTCPLTPLTFSWQEFSSIVPPVQSILRLLHWWRQPPQLGSGLLLPPATTGHCLYPHACPTVLLFWVSIFLPDHTLSTFKKLPFPSRWHFSAPAAKTAGQQ